MAAPIIGEILALLEPHRDPRRSAAEKAYLKSDLDFLGVPLPVIRASVQTWEKGHETAEAPRLALRLWAEPIHELRAFAIVLLERRAKRLDVAAMDVAEILLRRSYTWAYVDALAIRVVGVLVERHPELVTALDRWAKDQDFWLRRAALLALLPGLRRGEGDWDRFVRYADRMLEEREFFVRKAIGWVLREVGKKRPGLVIGFVEPRLERMSGLSFREGIKYLPLEDRERLRVARGR